MLSVGIRRGSSRRTGHRQHPCELHMLVSQGLFTCAQRCHPPCLLPEDRSQRISLRATHASVTGSTRVQLQRGDTNECFSRHACMTRQIIDSDRDDWWYHLFCPMHLCRRIMWLMRSAAAHCGSFGLVAQCHKMAICARTLLKKLPFVLSDRGCNQQTHALYRRPYIRSLARGI